MSLEDKDYQEDVIGCIYDDVIPDLKNELSVFMKATKMAARTQQEVDFINQKRSVSKSKATTISPPIFDSSIDKTIVTEVKEKNSVVVSPKFLNVSSLFVSIFEKNAVKCVLTT